MLSRLSEKRLRLRPMALHSGLTMAEQMEVFEPSPSDSRKVVVATNIAEVSPHLIRDYPILIFPLHQASITIEGVKFVVDSGFVKVINVLL
jgi:ATP-dependent RNA helicase DDX35